MTGQSVIQPTSKMAGFLPTVADKDATTLSHGHGQSRYRRAKAGRKAATSRAAASGPGHADPPERMMVDRPGVREAARGAEGQVGGPASSQRWPGDWSVSFLVSFMYVYLRPSPSTTAL